MKRPCSEFPNDNPDLYGSGSWDPAPEPPAPPCVPPRGRRASDAPERAEPPEPPQGPLAPQGSPEAAATPAPADSFRRLLSVFEDVARASGATDALVAAVSGLLFARDLEHPRAPEDAGPALGALPPASVEAMVAGTLVERTPRGIARTARFERAVLAWQRVLCAESEDYEGCGAATLDEWGADLIARVLGAPALSHGLRRELRRRGVAAFGLVDPA